MDENSKTLLILLSGMAIILIAFLLISGNVYPDGFGILGITPESSYSYEVTLSCSETLYNVTMFLPLPSYAGTSPVGFGILDGRGYGIPDNMVADVYGEGDSVSLKVILPETDGLKFGISVDADGIVDTADPVEGSYVMRPVKDLQAGENSIFYNTYVYASYDASPGATVNIDISETGKNSWESFSRKTNYFDEHASLTLSGPADKWHTAGVVLNKGKGDYSILF